MYRFNDRPGRYLAAFGIGPTAVAAGTLLLTCDSQECRTVVAVALLIFGPLMTLYELFWICRRDPEVAYLRTT